MRMRASVKAIASKRANRKEEEPREQHHLKIHSVLLLCRFVGTLPLAHWEKDKILSDFPQASEELSMPCRWRVRHNTASLWRWVPETITRTDSFLLSSKLLLLKQHLREMQPSS